MDDNEIANNTTEFMKLLANLLIERQNSIVALDKERAVGYLDLAEFISNVAILFDIELYVHDDVHSFVAQLPHILETIKTEVHELRSDLGTFRGAYKNTMEYRVITLEAELQEVKMRHPEPCCGAVDSAE